MSEYIIVERTFKDFNNPSTFVASSLDEAYELCNKRYEKILRNEEIKLNKEALTTNEILYGKSLFVSINYELLCLLFIKNNYDNLHN